MPTFVPFADIVADALQIDLLKSIGDQLPEILTGVVVFAVFYLVAKIVEWSVKKIAATKAIEPDLVKFLGSIVKTVILVFGLLTALGTAGMDVGALVAGLGLTGFALGFALKDVVSNVMAGLLILFYRPFDYDDKIKVSSFEGIVASIDLRYTVLTTSAEELIYVPNSMLFTNAVTVLDETKIRTKNQATKADDSQRG